jgi:hypothetical protein
MLTAAQRREKYYSSHPEKKAEYLASLVKYDVVGIVACDQDVRKINGHCRRHNLSIDKVYRTTEIRTMLDKLVKGQIVVANNPGDLGSTIDRFTAHKEILKKECHLHIRYPVPYQSETLNEKSQKYLYFGIASSTFDFINGYVSSDDEH